MFRRTKYVNVRSEIVKSDKCIDRNFSNDNTAIRVCVSIDGFQECDIVCNEFARQAFINHVKSMHRVY